MYEMRQQMIKEMKQNKWFSYIILAAAIFLFSQGSAIIRERIQVALPLILFSFILHINSMGDLTKRIFKINRSSAPNIALVVALSIITVVCYFRFLNIFYIFLLNIAAIAVYLIIAAINNKLKQEIKK